MPRIKALKTQYMLNDLQHHLRTMRKRSKLSQRKLGDKIGLHTNYISLIETGHSIPNYDALIRWFDVCEATDEEILKIMRG